MRVSTTLENSFVGLADRILKRFRQIDADTRKALKEINENDELKPEAIAQRREAIKADAAKQYADARRQLGGEVDKALSRLRKISVTPPATDPANAAMLTMLSLAPQVTETMIIRAAESCGSDATAAEIIQQIAAKNGIQIPPYCFAKQERHLRQSDIDALANDMRDTFRMFFDLRTEYRDHESVYDNAGHGVTDWKENALHFAQRGNTETTLRNIESGFEFGGSETMQSEFSAAYDAAAASPDF